MKWPSRTTRTETKSSMIKNCNHLGKNHRFHADNAGSGMTRVVFISTPKDLAWPTWPGSGYVETSDCWLAGMDRPGGSRYLYTCRPGESGTEELDSNLYGLSDYME